MVKIRKGNHEIKVTMGAYENTFKPLGYTLVEEKKQFYKNEIQKITVKNENNTLKSDDNTFKGKNKKQED